MLSRAFSLRPLLASLAFSCLAAPAMAMEFPLPAPGNDVIGEVRVITAKHEDTFADIAQRNDLGYSEMVAANPGVDPWLPGDGAQIVLPTRFILPPGPREGIVINIAEYRMYYFPEGKNVVYTYPLGIGREGWNSPVASTTITGKVPNPTWTPPPSIRAEHAADGDILPAIYPPGPDNPLGPYKFTLGTVGYLIHGSNKKFGIGMRVSHGCFRMLNNNVLELAKMAPVGTKVRIMNEPYKFGVSNGRVYMEAHTPLFETEEPLLMDKHAQVVSTLTRYSDSRVSSADLDWEVVRDVVAGEEGMPVEVASAREVMASATQ